MPLTPVLPENKNTLDARIAANLKDNGTQFITAEKLRNTLTPIVNSTYGLKTIWAGYIHTSWTSNRSNYQYYENYYDPYYFPPVQDPGGALVLNSALNKYQVTNLGSGLRINNLPDGSFTNVSATLLSTNTSNGVYGGGLTFDGTITGGVLSSLTVNNPGMSYIDGYLTNTALQLNLGGTGGSITPKLKFNLSRTIWPADNSGGTANGWWSNANNVFIPNIANILPPQATGGFPIGLVLSYSDVYGAGNTAERSTSRISRPYSGSSTLYRTGGDAAGAANNPGFIFNQAVSRDPFDYIPDFGEGILEIKVPIVYQPTVI